MCYEAKNTLYYYTTFNTKDYGHLFLKIRLFFTVSCSHLQRYILVDYNLNSYGNIAISMKEMGYL